MLSAVPPSTTPRFPRPTCVGYVRVSTTEQAHHGWSIEQQEDAIRAWADAQGLQLVSICRDAGRSGRTMRHRSGLLALLEMVHLGGIGVVVVKAQDRLARAVDHAIGLRHWIHRHGADLLFLDGDVHLRAAEAGGGGNLGADLLASLTAVLAEEEVATLRRRILPNLAQAARAGRRGGRTALGYCRLPDGTLVPDPHDADLVQQAVAAVQGGMGVSRLVRTWIAHGVRDSQGGIISFDRIRGALTNPFLTGALRYRLPPEVVGEDGTTEICIPAHHPALIDPVTFQQVQRCIQARARRPGSPEVEAERRARRRSQRRSHRLPPTGALLDALRPLAKLAHGAMPPDIVRCGTCGGPMYASLMTVGGLGKRTRRAVYLCRHHKDRGVAYCAQPPVPTTVVDDAVFAALVSQWRTWDLARPGQAAHAVAFPAAQAVAADLTAAEARRDRLLASVQALADHAPPALRDRLAATEAEIQALATRAQAERSGRIDVSGPAGQLRRHPQATWAALDHAGRRAAVRPLVVSVVVRGKAVRQVTVRDDAGQVHVVPLGTPP